MNLHGAAIRVLRDPLREHRCRDLALRFQVILEMPGDTVDGARQ